MTSWAGETLRLKPGVRSKAEAGHPWILSEEIDFEGRAPKDGVAVAYGGGGQLLGTGFTSSTSRIGWRRFRKDIGILDQAWVEQTLARSIQGREKMPSRRLFWSESDGIPGLVVDQYGEYLTVQITTRGVEDSWEIVREALVQLAQPKGILIRRDASGRKLEGLESLPSEVMGEVPEEPVLVEIGGLSVPVDLRHGQKTGTYLDQQENYGMVAAEAKGRKVLDLFCHNGGFALRCAAAGATEITGVDRSEPSLLLARAASLRNNLKIRWAQEDAIRFLRASRKGEYDLVILDPPGLGKSRESRDASLHFLAELHRQALRVLAPFGRLATFSCSYRIGSEDLKGMVNRVVKEEGRNLKVCSVLTQAKDHPVDPNFPESHYLSGLLLEVM